MLGEGGVAEDIGDGTPLDAAAAPPPASLEIAGARPIEAGDRGRIGAQAGGVVVRLPGDVAAARPAAIVAAGRGRQARAILPRRRLPIVIATGPVGAPVRA